ncbi:MAG: hypothetical protein V4671_02035 [Armatimonadota bacterium]
MKIRLTKGTGGKPGVTSFIREDGSCTWQKSTPFFARHDLIHYAVETALGYREAFLGLVARGRDLDSFGTQNGIKDVYTQEEIWTEAIAGICQWPDSTGAYPLSNQELLVILESSFEGKDCPAPAITEPQLLEIRSHVQEQHRRWDLVPEGETLEMTFELPV